MEAIAFWFQKVYDNIKCLGKQKSDFSQTHYIERHNYRDKRSNNYYD